MFSLLSDLEGKLTGKSDYFADHWLNSRESPGMEKTWAQKETEVFEAWFLYFWSIKESSEPQVKWSVERVQAERVGLWIQLANVLTNNYYTMRYDWKACSFLSQPIVGEGKLKISNIFMFLIELSLSRLSLSLRWRRFIETHKLSISRLGTLRN